MRRPPRLCEPHRHLARRRAVHSSFAQTRIVCPNPVAPILVLSTRSYDFNHTCQDVTVLKTSSGISSQHAPAESASSAEGLAVQKTQNLRGAPPPQAGASLASF